MKIQSIEFDKNEDPKSFVFQMSPEEANAILTVFGQFNSEAKRKLGLTDDHNIYDGIANVFNALYEYGRIGPRVKLFDLLMPDQIPCIQVQPDPLSAQIQSDPLRSQVQPDPLHNRHH